MTSPDDLLPNHAKYDGGCILQLLHPKRAETDLPLDGSPSIFLRCRLGNLWMRTPDKICRSTCR